MVAKFWVSIWFDGDDSFMIEAPSKAQVESALSGFWVEDYITQMIQDGEVQITVDVVEASEDDKVEAKLNDSGKIEWVYSG